MEAVKAYDQVKTDIEAIQNDASAVVEHMDINDAQVQGDVMIRRIAAVPPDTRRVSRPSLQVAPGTTQGSRHTLDSLDGLAVFALASPNACEGPVIEANRRWELRHPEHGDVSFPPGVYAIEYQRAYAEELRRVAD